jgi:hypothetical protein
MAIAWTLTVDCAHPQALASFWKQALGYTGAPPPIGFISWRDWFAGLGVPEEEWDDSAYVVDPDGIGPRISFIRVPEDKITKNRIHLDISVGGGRTEPLESRWPRVMQKVADLKAAGATVLEAFQLGSMPEHVVMADPEGNEFCVL